jgi:hypothetical protein
MSGTWKLVLPEPTQQEMVDVIARRIMGWTRLKAAWLDNAGQNVQGWLWNPFDDERAAFAVQARLIELGLRADYLDELMWVLDVYVSSDNNKIMNALTFATAAQRAEAAFRVVLFMLKKGQPE